MTVSKTWRPSLRGTVASLFVCLSLTWANAVQAQSTPAAVATAQPATTAANTGVSNPIVDPAIQQAGCTSCGGALEGPPEVAGCSGGCGSGGCNQGCYPGRDRSKCACCGCDPDSALGRCFCCLYNCICCPDPCYDPHWIPLVDSAFFVESARPVTQMDLIWDSGFDLQSPDRAEYFYARENVNQIGPGGKKSTGRGPGFVASTVNHDDFDLYMEAGTASFGAWVLTPYREVDFHGGTTAAALGESMGDKSGFGDVTIGTKSVLLDCPCMLLSFGFNTYIPAGDTGKGLGTGHVSLEPALLMDFRLTPDDYLETDIAYWIPLGGDPLYQGNILRSGVSWNHLLWCPCPGVKLIGTLEAEEWTILGGSYTPSDINPPVVASANTTIVSAGPGLRCFICDKVDLGVGTQFALTGERWDQELVRAEFRWRF
jgi:hypothetical protein